MSRRGTTLVEVAVALLLLSVGALAAASGLAESERARRRALATGLALAAAESWLEAWRLRPGPSVPGTGTETVAWGPWRGSVEWTVGAPAGCRAEARVAARAGGGPAVVLASRRFEEGPGDGC